jgi:hypothetical protein
MGVSCRLSIVPTQFLACEQTVLFVCTCIQSIGHHVSLVFLDIKKKSAMNWNFGL